MGVDLLPVSLDHVCVGGTCADDVDQCPTDGAKTAPGLCGCGVSDAFDADGDGTPDCNDLCPGMPDKLGHGKCGCAAASEDGDGDGLANCLDDCPRDIEKRAPAICGCGIADEDDDGDGLPDCVDACPADPRKALAGACGCGVVESAGDKDADGKLDCVDFCNGVDDARYRPDRSCGVGSCQQNNTPSSCTAGVETACVPGAPRASSDAICDGVDDDCDGTVDEDFPSSSTLCGVGACAASGMRVCLAGVQRDTCAPRAAAANDATCGGDDDCDGVLDEDFKPSVSVCGLGTCMATGMLTCESGVASDSCVPGTPQVSVDASCDGVDQDCSGSADEDFVLLASACGVGSCAASGVVMCVNASTVDSCVPGQPAANDATCNGLDEDCNGTSDEDFTPTASACGVGACRASGTLTCVSGATRDSCTPRAPGANDATCNGIDEDCSGAADEDYVPVASNCGLGVCRRSGTITCAGGTTSDSCVAGAPATTQDGPPANGLDDDCDGQIDEDACTTTPSVFGPGAYPSLSVPAGCTAGVVQLWGGGGGAGGKTSVGTTGTPGSGGSGGYVSQKVVFSAAVNLYVGNGGTGCGAGGTNPGSASYNGGDGADLGGNGSAGADGSIPGGGSGATTGTGNGARGYYGGGGGGSGTLQAIPPYPGRGGGGGAASVLLVGGTRTMFAGGGGGGGGANGASITSVGGAGGSGCSGSGTGANAGGGGGGGVCVGTTTSRGTGVTPANAGLLPGGRANGGPDDCDSGGGGYAIITWSAN